MTRIKMLDRLFELDTNLTDKWSILKLLYMSDNEIMKLLIKVQNEYLKKATEVNLI